MSRHGRAKQYGPEPPAAVYTKPPPPVHGNNTYNDRAHHHYQQQSQHHQQLLQQQYYGAQQQPNIVGTRPTSSNYQHHSLPRNAWCTDRHSPAAGESSSNSSNERTYSTNRRAKHHRVYNSHRYASRTLHKMGSSGATTDPDALSSVTTAGIKYSQQPPLPLHHHSQHRSQMQAGATAWPSEPSSSSVTLHHQQPAAVASTTTTQYLPPLPPQNPATRQQPSQTVTGLPTAATMVGGSGLVLRHNQQPSTGMPLLLQPSCDVAVDACGGHCPRFENFCHFCLLAFYFSGITVGFLLIMAAIVSTRDPRFLYIGGLVLPVSAFLMAVQCRVRQDADRRKRHRLQLNGRHHQNRSNAAAAVMVYNGNIGGAGQSSSVTVAAETIPMQNIAMMAGSDNTLRRQFQGNVYQYVSQRDECNSHHYETTSDSQQIEGVPWWRREENRQYHSRGPPHL